MTLPPNWQNLSGEERPSLGSGQWGWQAVALEGAGSKLKGLSASLGYRL